MHSFLLQFRRDTAEGSRLTLFHQNFAVDIAAWLRRHTRRLRKITGHVRINPLGLLYLMIGKFVREDTFAQHITSRSIIRLVNRLVFWVRIDR